jgi:integrase
MARGRPFRAAKITDECFAAVIRAFMASPKFQGYSPATREVWGRELRLAERPDTLGAISVNVIRPALVQAFMDGMSDRPGKQAAALAALRQLERWGIVRDLLPQPITLGVEIGRSHDGHKPWTDEQVRLAETHARPELARVVTLAANTGQRGSDLVKMRWTDLEDYNGRTGIWAADMGAHHTGARQRDGPMGAQARIHSFAPHGHSLDAQSAYLGVDRRARRQSGTTASRRPCAARLTRDGVRAASAGRG